MDHALDENSRRDDVIGIDVARLYQMLDLGHRHLARGRHHRIKIARRLAVDEVAFGIAQIGVDDRQIGDDAALHDVALAVEFAHVLALGDLGADAGLGEERRDAGAAGADALGQRALRVELDLELAGEVLLHEGLVLPHIGGDHFLGLAAVEQDAQALAVDAGIVGHHGQILDAGIADRKDQGFWDTAQAETAGHDGHAILEQPGQCGFGIRMDLVHDRSISPGNELRIAGPAERSTGQGADAEPQAIWRWSAAT